MKTYFSYVWHSLIRGVILLVVAFSVFSCSEQPAWPPPPGGGGEAFPDLKTNAMAMQQWQDMRFGMFVHWGPVALQGTEIGWSRGREVPISVYDSLYLRFNPMRFKADEWISLAKEAGMKYFVITTKHHDGFSIWPSKYTDYDIESTPFKRDVLREMQLACEKHGILFGTYHSILDWKHPHYTTRYNDPRPVEESDMSIYKEFLFNQVEELVEDYQTNILWFDGQWEASWTHQDGMELYKFIRDLKDDILINNRVDKGYKSMAGMTDSVAKYAGDFGTPEQRIGGFNRDFPWESCITVGEQWAWKPDDQLKTSEELILTLIKTIGGNGNLLLNVGPMPDGRIEPRQVELLKEVGRWLQVNGEGVYGTRGGPYLPNNQLVTTHKGQDVFVHVMDDNLKEIILPLPEGIRVRAVSLLGGNRVSYTTDKVNLRIEVPDRLPAAPAYVLRIRINRPAHLLDDIKLEW